MVQQSCKCPIDHLLINLLYQPNQTAWPILSTKDPSVISCHKLPTKTLPLFLVSSQTSQESSIYTHTFEHLYCVCQSVERLFIAGMWMLMVVALSTIEPITNNSHLDLISIQKAKTLTGANKAHTLARYVTLNVWNGGVVALYRR